MAFSHSYNKQRLSKLDHFTVFNQHFFDNSVTLTFNFIHQLHCFNNTKHLSFFYAISDLHKWVFSFSRCFIKHAYQW